MPRVCTASSGISLGECSPLFSSTARPALTTAGLALANIDCLVSANAGPEQALPCNAAFLHRELGLTRIAAFDVDATCLSFLLGPAAHGMPISYPAGISTRSLPVIGPWALAHPARQQWRGRKWIVRMARSSASARVTMNNVARPKIGPPEVSGGRDHTRST
jgi:hypothetical protein